MLTLIRHQCEYEAVKELSEEKHYPINKLCGYLHITRSAYYRWLKCPKSRHQLKNEGIAGEIRKIHDEHPDMGYRRIRDELAVNRDIKVNDKRVLNISRKLQIHSCIKYRPKSCTKDSSNPYHIAKNYLNKEFHAEAPNQKWLTDVSEFKYYTGIEIHKVYLSAILDLYDRRIVAFKISDHNPEFDSWRIRKRRQTLKFQGSHLLSAFQECCMKVVIGRNAQWCLKNRKN